MSEVSHFMCPTDKFVCHTATLSTFPDARAHCTNLTGRRDQPPPLASQDKDNSLKGNVRESTKLRLACWTREKFLKTSPVLTLRNSGRLCLAVMIITRPDKILQGKHVGADYSNDLLAPPFTSH